MNDPKTCPYCGSKKVGCYESWNLWACQCDECGATMVKRGSKEEAIEAWNTRAVNGETSDGYHTFDELYHHRAVLFSKVVEFAGERAWKSKLHDDGAMFDGFFIVGVETPEGQATYHYAIDPYWEMFDCKEVEHAPVWDGHTPQEAIARIEHWNTRAERTCKMTWHYSDNGGSAYTCSNCGRDTYPFSKSFEHCPHCTAKVVE